jgi:SAM-dependent methyltransferase
MSPPHDSAVDPYFLRDGIYVREKPLLHDAEQYDARGYEILREMQRQHFWYRGRHRFLEAAARRYAAASPNLRVIDLGAGCGGWMAHLMESALFPDAELALGDSSLIALENSRQLAGGRIQRFQIDLLDLGFERRWDVAFLLDVIEHLDDDVEALRNAERALVPGGLLFVTVPALQVFWSWNDEVVKHKRRYDEGQLVRAAEAAGFEALDTRYFMFFLSPFLLLSRRLNQASIAKLSEQEKWALVERTHRVPFAPVNALLGGALALETPLSRLLRFPYGSSLLGVFRKRVGPAEDKVAS